MKRKGRYYSAYMYNGVNWSELLSFTRAIHDIRRCDIRSTGKGVLPLDQTQVNYHSCHGIMYHYELIQDQHIAGPTNCQYLKRFCIGGLPWMNVNEDDIKNVCPYTCK